MIQPKWGKRKAVVTTGSAKSRSSKKAKSPISSKSNPKKSVSTGKKRTGKVLTKAGGKTIKAASKSAKLGLSMVQSLYNISDTAQENRQMQNYVNLASQMSPEYRRRFMYD